MLASACAVLAPLSAPADCVAAVQALVTGLVILAVVVIALAACHARRP